MPGVFLTVEGIEGVGKSTVVQFIQRFFSDNNIHLKVTREPGGTPLAESFRSLLLQAHPQEKLTKISEVLLMFASRSQHIENLIQPALEAGHWVLSDRFVDASFAYQGGGRQIAREKIQFLSDWIVGDRMPDMTLLLDAPVDVAMGRVKRRALDRIEQEAHSFFEEVRETYLALAKASPERFRVIDASLPLPEVQAQIEICLKEFIKSKKS